MHCCQITNPAGRSALHKLTVHQVVRGQSAALSIVLATGQQIQFLLLFSPFKPMCCYTSDICCSPHLGLCTATQVMMMLQVTPQQHTGNHLVEQDLIADIMAQELLAEEEQVKAKAAAKKAKKQKQTAKKGQLAPPVPPGIDASGTSSATAADAGIAVAEVPPSKDSFSLGMERMRLTSDAAAESDRFLEELFCCPLTKVNFTVLRHCFGLTVYFQSCH